MIRWLILCVCAFALCGCGESRAEFDALNAGKISVVYENQTLKIAESRADSAILQKEPPTNSSIVDEKSGLRSHEREDRTNGSSTKRVASLPDLSPQDEFDFILFFFTSTCGVCKAQIPILEQLSAQGIKIYAILGDMPDISKASAFASVHKISLPLFYESSAKRFFTSAVGGVKGVPVVAIFSNGKMKEKFIGLTPKSTLLRAL